MFDLEAIQKLDLFKDLSTDQVAALFRLCGLSNKLRKTNEKLITLALLRDSRS